MWSGSCPASALATRSGSTCDPPPAAGSPGPTELNGRTIVYGSWYWSHAARAKYSTASLLNPYDVAGGGISRSCPSALGQSVADSYTMDEDTHVTLRRRPVRCARIAASAAAAVIRSLAASRS